MSTASVKDSGRSDIVNDDPALESRLKLSLSFEFTENNSCDVLDVGDAEDLVYGPRWKS
jgi:hypothetical protein